MIEPSRSASSLASHIRLLGHVIEIEATRVLSDAAWPIRGLATQQMDAYLFVLALRNLIRAAEYALSQSTGNTKLAIDAAITSFNAKIPHAPYIREALEHLDEFPGFPVVAWHERREDRHFAVVGTIERVPIRLDIGASQLAARELVIEVTEAFTISQLAS